MKNRTAIIGLTILALLPAAFHNGTAAEKMATPVVDKAESKEAKEKSDMTNRPKYVIEDVESKVIAAKSGRYYGRCVLVELPSDPIVWVLFYHEASHHWACKDGVMHIRFSNDYGESWSAEDKHLDGTEVSAFPAWPPEAEPSSPDYPCEPWAYLAPNGDLVLHTLNRRSAPSVFKGTWQIRSSDGGRTWSNWSELKIQGVKDSRRILAIEDDFVVNGIVYQSAKSLSNHTGKIPPVRNILIRSSDSGLTWKKVSNITSFEENTNECGIEFLGNKTIIAHAIDLTYKRNIQKISHDMGATWGETQSLTYGTGDSVVSMHRERLKTLRHIRGETEWWLDPVLLVASNANIFHENKNPRRRRNGVFISPDRGKTWQRPQWLDEETQDAGYGDTSWDPKSGKYVAWLYQGSNDEAVLKQYKFTIRLIEEKIETAKP